MNKTLLLIISGLLVVIVLIAAQQTYFAKTVEYDQSNVGRERTFSGNTHASQLFGYSIIYPRDWEVFYESAETGSTAFGDPANFKKGGYDGEWLVRFFPEGTIDTEAYISSSGGQFADRQLQRKEILINSHPATYVRAITESNPEWILEQVTVEGNEGIFVISNGAVRHPLFKDFYSSFRLHSTQ